MLTDPDGLGKLAAEIQAVAKRRTVTIASAESCTGGLLAYLLTRWPGSSEVYLGGVSAYANSVKTALLAVDPELIARHGAVSAAVAEAMALGVQSCTGSTYGVSITGVAGPGGGTPQKPVGTVFIGLAGLRGVTSAHLSLNGSRDSIREQAARGTLELLLKALNSEGNP